MWLVVWDVVHSGDGRTHVDRRTRGMLVPDGEVSDVVVALRCEGAEDVRSIHCDEIDMSRAVVRQWAQTVWPNETEAPRWWHAFTPGIASPILCGFCGKTAGEHTSPALDVERPRIGDPIVRKAVQRAGE